MWTRTLSRYVPAILLAGALGGCTVSGRAFVRTPGVIIIEDDPPPPRRTIIVQRPGHVWIEGHWGNNNGRWVWYDGYHQRARADHHWINGRWEPRGRGHVWIDGRWEGRGQVRGKRERGRARNQDHR